MWILQVLGLKKSNLDFVDENGKRVRMIKPTPAWVKFLKDPLRQLKKKKEDFLNKNAYGPPWIENEEMFQEFVDECTAKTISLQTVHDCMTQKVDPNKPFKKLNNNRGMHYAARHGNIMMAMMLLRAGAAINPRNALGQTPLMVAASGRFAHHTHFLRWLISKEVDVQEKDRGGNTALVLAVISSARTNVGLLLHHKASIAFTEKKLLTLEDPDVLAIAKYLRAVDNGLPLESAEEYFEIQEFLGPSILDRIIGMGICSESHKLVSMLERAQEGKYLNYYEIHMQNLNSGLKKFFFKYILRRNEVKVKEKKQELVLPMQKADEKDIRRMMDAKRRAKELKKQHADREMQARNLEAARREIAAVQSADTLALLYGKKQAGQWQRKPEKKRKGKETMQDLLKDGRRKKEGEGKSQVKSRWEFQEVEADRSLGVKLDVQKFIGYDASGGKTVDELKEEKAIAKLVTKLDELDGKKISDIEFHKRVFDLNMRDLPESRDGDGNVISYKNGQRKTLRKMAVKKDKMVKEVVQQEDGYMSDGPMSDLSDEGGDEGAAKKESVKKESLKKKFKKEKKRAKKERSGRKAYSGSGGDER